MKLIVLAAGYATRLYPLTLNQPKPLLDVAGKPMLEHVLDHRLARDLQQRLRLVQRQRVEPRRVARRQNDQFHKLPFACG